MVSLHIPGHCPLRETKAGTQGRNLEEGAEAEAMQERGHTYMHINKKLINLYKKAKEQGFGSHRESGPPHTVVWH